VGPTGLHCESRKRGFAALSRLGRMRFSTSAHRRFTGAISGGDGTTMVPSRPFVGRFAVA
jgi:hypothetical protein